MARKRTEVLHVMQFSTQWSDPWNQREADLDFAFKKEPDVISFTEIGSPEARNMLNRKARQHGYHPVMARGDCSFAVRKVGYLRVKDKGSVPVHPGVQGQYPDKFVAWVKFTFYDTVIYLHAGHWVTKAQEGGIRKQRHVKLSKAMAHQVSKHGRQQAISLWSGDMNADPDQGKYPTELFREHGLRSCWQDAGVQVKTHTWSTLDVIGRWAEDKNCEFKRFKTWPYQNSDHRPFSVWYEVDLTRKNNNGGNNAGNGGGKDTKPNKKFLHAGDVSFADYKDTEVYALPYAVDDSDTYNG